jgi:hypothetical protein
LGIGTRNIILKTATILGRMPQSRSRSIRDSRFQSEIAASRALVPPSASLIKGVHTKVIWLPTPTIAAQFAFAHRSLPTCQFDPRQRGLSVPECSNHFRCTPEADIRFQRNICRDGPGATFRTAEKQRCRTTMKSVTGLRRADPGGALKQAHPKDQDHSTILRTGQRKFYSERQDAVRDPDLITPLRSGELRLVLEGGYSKRGTLQSPKRAAPRSYGGTIHWSRFADGSLHRVKQRTAPNSGLR